MAHIHCHDVQRDRRRRSSAQTALKSLIGPNSSGPAVLLYRKSSGPAVYYIFPKIGALDQFFRTGLLYKLRPQRTVILASGWGFPLNAAGRRLPGRRH